jgi:hypothetical protein
MIALVFIVLSRIGNEKLLDLFFKLIFREDKINARKFKFNPLLQH